MCQRLLLPEVLNASFNIVEKHLIISQCPICMRSDMIVIFLFNNMKFNSLIALINNNNFSC